MDTGSEYESAFLEQDTLEDHPVSSNADGLKYQPSSSEEDESDHVPREPAKVNKPLEMHRGPVIFEQHHLRADTDIEVRAVVSVRETLELRDGSFLKIACFGNTKESQSLTFFGHLLRGIEKFQEHLPVTYGGSELVMVCEEKQQDPKPGGGLSSATSKEVLRIRHFVLPISEAASDSILQFEATELRSLICQWMLAAELSNSHVTGGKRSSRSTMRRSQGQLKAFIALSSQEPLVEEIMAVDFPHHHHSQHELDDALPKTSSNDSLCQPKKHGHTQSKNVRKSKRHCKDAGRSMVLAPNTISNRITKATRYLGRRKSYPAALYLQPWNTVQDAIDRTSTTAPQTTFSAHGRTERRIEDWAPPHPSQRPRHGTVTTGENWRDHYSGKYRCTARKAACVQGFPVDYACCGDLSATMKQVANALPPPFAKAILEEVKRSLMASRRS